MLLLLPDHILIRFIVDWMSVVDVAHLDAACCSCTIRHQLHHVLSLPNLVLNNPYDVTRGLEWFAARQLKYSNFFLSKSTTKVSAVGQYLTTVGGDHIRLIRMSEAADKGAVLIAVLATICSSVERIYIDDCGGLACIDWLVRRSSTALVTIHISNCKVDDCSGLDGLHLPWLRRLHLQITASAEVLSKFLGLSDRLEQVYIKETQFDDHCSFLLRASAKTLRKLDLMYCRGVSDSRLQEIAQEAVNLALIKCGDLSEVTLISFLSRCPRLTSIAFAGVFTEAILVAIAEHCGPRLQHLALNNVQCSGDAGLDALAHRCLSIESLDWTSTRQSTPALCHFIRSQTQLCELSFGECAIDDSVLLAVTTHGQRLQHLDLYETTGYTDEGLRSLARLCPALKKVCIERNSPLITPLVRNWWQVHRPELTFSHAYLYCPFWTTHWTCV